MCDKSFSRALVKAGEESQLIHHLYLPMLTCNSEAQPSQRQASVSKVASLYMTEAPKRQDLSLLSNKRSPRKVPSIQVFNNYLLNGWRDGRIERVESLCLGTPNSCDGIITSIIIFLITLSC